jgi:hypothetical protein
VSQTGERASRHAWPLAVREAAEELARDRDRSAADVRRALSEDQGVDVPTDTVARWVKELRRREPIDRASVLRDIADRASLLLSAELDRLERGVLRRPRPRRVLRPAQSRIGPRSARSADQTDHPSLALRKALRRLTCGHLCSAGRLTSLRRPWA